MPLCHFGRPQECSGSMPNIHTHYQQNVEEELQANTLEICTYRTCPDWLPSKAPNTTAEIPFKLFKAPVAAQTIKRKIRRMPKGLSAFSYIVELTTRCLGAHFLPAVIGDRIRKIKVGGKPPKSCLYFLPGMQNYCWISIQLLTDPNTAKPLSACCILLRIGCKFLHKLCHGHDIDHWPPWQQQNPQKHPLYYNEDLMKPVLLQNFNPWRCLLSSAQFSLHHSPACFLTD